MFRNLSPQKLNVSGRQSELIELALTYGFRGLDVDMGQLAKRAANSTNEHASRFLRSGELKIGGFEIPINLYGDDASFASEIQRVSQIGELCQHNEAERCIVTIPATDANRSFQENFEFHRDRIGQAAQAFQPYNVRLGLTLLADPSQETPSGQYEFIDKIESLLTLVKTIGVSNVGVTLDTWDWFVSDGGLDQIRELTVDQIVCVRLADYPVDTDVTKISRRDLHLPGAGGVPLQDVMRHLVDVNYEGPVAPAASFAVLQGKTRETIVQRAQTALDDLFLAIGLAKSGRPLTEEEAEENAAAAAAAAEDAPAEAEATAAE